MPVEDVVERYNQSAKLFRIRYVSKRIGDDAEDLDLMTLQDLLILGKEYGDERKDWGRTRDERTRTVTCKLRDSHQGDNKEDEQGGRSIDLL